jgi:putative NADPH-quinone reductase
MHQTKKNVLLILGHPNDDSLSHKILAHYRKGAEENGASIKEIIVRNLDFEPILFKGYKRTDALEEDILRSQQDFRWADHIVFIYPNWWGTYPALFKAFIDKVLWPGFAFAFKPGVLKWVKLMKGKSVRIFVTMDTPLWYYHLVQGAPGHKAMKKATLGFCGFHPVKIKSFAPVKKASEKQVNRWLNKVERFGRKLS